MSKIDNNKIKISGLEYLYDNGKLSNSDTLRNIPLKELFTFREHPFLVVDDEKMAETVESIRKYGVLNPGIARPRKGGGYEIISGHRRKRALDSFLNSIINVNQNGKNKKISRNGKIRKNTKITDFIENEG